MYSNSKIYCLHCIDGYFYIGCTTNELRYRLSEHKLHSKKIPERRVYKHILNLGWDNVIIDLIEEFSCNNRKELLQKENEYIASNIDDEYCLNNNISFQTPEELKAKQMAYRQDNRDRILEYKEMYRKKNADKINEYTKQYEEANREILKEKKRIYNQKNKEVLAKKCKDYAQTHKEQIREYKKKWVEENKDRVKETFKKYREENKEVVSKKGKDYYAANKEKCRKAMKEYREKNIELCRAREKQYRETKKQTSPEVSQSCCICGGTYVAHHKKRHESSKKHTAALEKSPQPSE